MRSISCGLNTAPFHTRISKHLGVSTLTEITCKTSPTQDFSRLLLSSIYKHCNDTGQLVSLTTCLSCFHLALSPTLNFYFSTQTLAKRKYFLYPSFLFLTYLWLAFLFSLIYQQVVFYFLVWQYCNFWWRALRRNVNCSFSLLLSFMAVHIT